MVTQWLAGQDITVDRLNDNHPRTISYTGITANTAASSGTTESVGITTSSLTMRNNRAFKVTYKALIQSSVANDVANVRVRRTNISGATLLDSQRIATTVAANANILFCFQNIFTNTTGADITDVLVGTYFRGTTGTGNITLAASGTQVAYIEVEDIGVASDFPSATAIT